MAGMSLSQISDPIRNAERALGKALEATASLRHAALGHAAMRLPGILRRWRQHDFRAFVAGIAELGRDGMEVEEILWWWSQIRGSLSR